MARIGGVPTASNAIATMNSNTMFRLPEDLRLTREAMERYLRDRNDKIIVILHAKVQYTVAHGKFIARQIGNRHHHPKWLAHSPIGCLRCHAI